MSSTDNLQLSKAHSSRYGRAAWRGSTIDQPRTPYYLYDEALLCEHALAARRVADAIGARLLYSVKACVLGGVIAVIAPAVDGFSCSSLHEIEAAATVRSSKRQTLHFCAPAIRPDEIDRLAVASDYLTLNSLSQWRRFAETLRAAGVRCGLRINPELSFVDDIRYDPCRPGTKLGVAAGEICHALEGNERSLEEISGCHFHNNADSTDFAQLARTLDKIVGTFPSELLDRISWINIGGGYFCDGAVGLDALENALNRFRKGRPVDVFFEPGAAFVREAAVLVSSVIDVFRSGDTTVAILDSTVNHYPNFLTYGSAAEIDVPQVGAGHRYTLAGITCLAGDLFGISDFVAPLEIGARVVIKHVGAYGAVKMNMFNGVPLPDIYLKSIDGEMRLLNTSSYGDYIRVNVGV